MPTTRFRCRRILEALDRHAVQHIAVGGVCAVAHGAPIPTFDLDLVHLRTAENIDRIMAALAEMGAYHREPGEQRLTPQRSVLEGAGPGLFTTEHGSLDLLDELSGRGYAELLPHTLELRLDGGLRLRLLDLETLIEVKAAAGRPKEWPSCRSCGRRWPRAAAGAVRSRDARVLGQSLGPAPRRLALTPESEHDSHVGSARLDSSRRPCYGRPGPRR